MIFVLNGTTSSGKTTLCKSILGSISKPILYFNFDFIVPSIIPDIDSFEPIEVGGNTFKRKLNRQMIHRFNNAGLLPDIERAVSQSLFSYANNGFDILIDTILWPEDNTLKDIQEACSGHELALIGLHCPLEELERREKLRGNRRIGNARKQFEIVHKNTDIIWS